MEKEPCIMRSNPASSISPNLLKTTIKTPQQKRQQITSNLPQLLPHSPIANPSVPRTGVKTKQTKKRSQTKRKRTQTLEALKRCGSELKIWLSPSTFLEQLAC
jgi:hypothetical protein